MACNCTVHINNYAGDRVRTRVRRSFSDTTNRICVYLTPEQMAWVERQLFLKRQEVQRFVPRYAVLSDLVEQARLAEVNRDHSA